jgi:hypothetical protein
MSDPMSAFGGKAELAILWVHAVTKNAGIGPTLYKDREAKNQPAGWLLRRSRGVRDLPPEDDAFSKRCHAP